MLIIHMLLALWLPQVHAQTVSSIDLADYFPTRVTQKTYRTGSGAAYATYTYSPNPVDFLGLYFQFFNLQRAGSLGVWTKHYAGSPMPATHALLFFGRDKSVTELGDYYNLGLSSGNQFVLFGYRNPYGGHAVDGLRWAHASGQIGLSNVVHPYVQPGPGREFTFKSTDAANTAYTYVVAQRLSSFQPQYGRRNGQWGKGNGTKYSDVLRLLFYHGTNHGNVGLDCSQKAGNFLKAQYAKVPGFNSYVSEYYLAKGKWIIQERTLYIEDASYWRNQGINVPDCSGAAFSPSSDGSYGASYED